MTEEKTEKVHVKCDYFFSDGRFFSSHEGDVDFMEDVTSLREFGEKLRSLGILPGVSCWNHPFVITVGGIPTLLPTHFIPVQYQMSYTD